MAENNNGRPTISKELSSVPASPISTSSSGSDQNHNLKIQIFNLTAVRVVPGISERMVYPFLTVFARGLGVGLNAISVAISFRAFIGIFSPFLSAAIEQYGRKMGILLGLGMIIVSSLLMTIFPSYGFFFFFLCMGYIGGGIIVTSQQAFVGDQIPYVQRGRVIGLVETSWAISFIVGMPIIAFLIDHWGWTAPFPFITLLGTVFFISIFHNMPADRKKIVPPTLGSTWRTLRSALANSPARAALFYTALIIAANECIGLVFGVWIADTVGTAPNLEVAALGAASVIIGAAELCGELLSGGIVDRFGKQTSVTAGVILNSLVAFCLPWLGFSLWSAYAGLFLFFFTFEFSVVAGITILTEILPSMRVTLLGLTNGAAAFGRMSGAMIASTLYAMNFHFNSIGVVLLNLACLFALSRIKIDADHQPAHASTPVN